MKRVVMFSGGVGSWAAGRRVAEAYGTDDLTLLFADTLIEDEDLYRFLYVAARDVGGRLVVIAEGRDPWQIFFDERYLGNSRIDPCSKKLKREFMRRWLEETYRPEEVTVYLGIDWTEAHRLEGAKARWAPYLCEAPMCEKPYTTKAEMLADLQGRGLEVPRLYAAGFEHNNCGGFCIKAGQGSFARLLAWNRERYLYHERREQELREFLKKDVAIMRERSGGRSRPLTMREFREKLDAGGSCDLLDIGGLRVRHVRGQFLHGEDCGEPARGGPCRRTLGHGGGHRHDGQERILSIDTDSRDSRLIAGLIVPPSDSPPSRGSLNPAPDSQGDSSLPEGAKRREIVEGLES